MKASAFTGEVLFLGIFFACLLDVALEFCLGNEYTISWTVLGIEAHHPIFGLSRRLYAHDTRRTSYATAYGRCAGVVALDRINCRTVADCRRDHVYRDPSERVRRRHGVPSEDVRGRREPLEVVRLGVRNGRSWFAQRHVVCTATHGITVGSAKR